MTFLSSTCSYNKLPHVIIATAFCHKLICRCVSLEIAFVTVIVTCFHGDDIKSYHWQGHPPVTMIVLLNYTAIVLVTPTPLQPLRNMAVRWIHEAIVLIMPTPLVTTYFHGNQIDSDSLIVYIVFITSALWQPIIYPSNLIDSWSHRFDNTFGNNLLPWQPFCYHGNYYWFMQTLC